MLVTLDLAPYPASVGEARRFTVETLARWGRDDLAATAALLVSELVTNSILHARTAVQVMLERRADGVRVEVSDGSPVRPTLRHHAPDATTGRGLALVARLAASWGVEVSDTGKSVWVDLAEEVAEQSPPDHLSAIVDLEETDEHGPGAGGSATVRDHHGQALAGWGSTLGRCA